jgi:NitT/TauT family transport system ATP-binding protein
MPSLDVADSIMLKEVTKPESDAGLAGPALEVRDVVKTFKSAGRPVHHALQGISFNVAKGEFISIVGPSGCGKSTLLYVIGGFILPTSGAVLADGKPVRGPGRDRGPVFQEYALFPWKTVLGNVMYGLLQQGMRRRDAEARAREWLAMVRLSDFEDFFPAELSGGMKQRVAIARTLAYGPSTLLMDEPFGALDAHTRTNMQNELLNIWERDRKAVLFVTHAVDESVFLSDRVIVMAPQGGIRTIIDIDLPRPRIRADLLVNARYQRLVVDIEALIVEQEQTADVRQ